MAFSVVYVAGELLHTVERAHPSTAALYLVYHASLPSASSVVAASGYFLLVITSQWI